jgi:hypothetical protein
VNRTLIMLCVLTSPLAPQQPATVDSPAATIAREYAALNRHDLDGVFAVYADSLTYGSLGDSTLPKATSKNKLRADFAPFLQQNPHGHVVVTHEIVVGPFVIAVERMTGAADGQPFVLVDISEVRHGRVVAELETTNIAATPATVSRDADGVANAADDAFTRGDPAGALASYASVVHFHVWGEDSVRHMTPARIQQGFQKLAAANPHMRFAVVERAVAGPFVITHERITGMADRVRLDAFDVMEVRNGHIVDDWESPWIRAQSSSPARLPLPTQS